MANICVVVASEMTARAFLLDHLRALSEKHAVSLVVHTRDPDLLRRHGVNARVVPMRIAREISPRADVLTLLRLRRFFRDNRFDLVCSVTPKAGLLAMMAGALAGVPARLHTFTGQVWATQRGPYRQLLKSMDRVLAGCATHLLADSASQRQFLLREGVVRRAAKIRVLASGSISGVDIKRFRPDTDARAAIRRELGISAAAAIVLFVGRLTCDKGVLDLAQAFARAAAGSPSSHLVVVGPDEDGMQDQMQRLCAGCADRLHFVGQTTTPERFMAAADLFCLPSYREGFGSVIIEAAAAGLPAVASRIYGITDAVVDGVTGLLHEPRNIEDLERCLRRYVASPELRRAAGDAARARACNEFSSTLVTDALLQHCQDVLEQSMASPSSTRA